MKSKKLIVSIGLIILVLVVSSCSMLPQGIKNLLATKTSTATSTPEATSTPRPTSTATGTPTMTSTPRSPITLIPCVYQDTCPEAILIDELMGKEPNPEMLNEVKVPFDQPVWIFTGWIFKDQSALDDAMSHIKWTILVDGQDYFQSSWTEPVMIPDQNDPSIEYPGMYFGVAISDWQIGDPHYVSIGYSLTEAIHDGWGDYPAGYSFSISYYFIPGNPPTSTATSEPTSTSTPRPVVATTRAPAAQSTTAVPSSDDNASVEHRLGTVPVTITNNNSVAIRIVAEGPTTYTVTVNGGQTINVRWAPGNYSLTAYKNGSYYASTVWDVNENHALFTIN